MENGDLSVFNLEAGTAEMERGRRGEDYVSTERRHHLQTLRNDAQGGNELRVTVLANESNSKVALIFRRLSQACDEGS